VNTWFNIGFTAPGILNLTPKESYELCREGFIFMNAHGYENVANMAGGIVNWERDGLSLTTDISNRLSGSCMCKLKARENRKKKS